ncbi:bifunctional NAD(P)H-hydrate repair enzyme [Camelimonas fluminis]|uniref:Bifunctional NAD(P)H-hydrate repair enzyme n=1 Tax=Camelimonas fluminis TaxID=1576911 RepID=A0ABV7UKA5_9HYPH|nr:NAD(P)H-hydrate dehydratase [Camelimonas fluminis]GHE58461.1 bifunctional NAD(P)H-hydrate repair enzyme [Camelimonas fluminis]
MAGQSGEYLLRASWMAEADRITIASGVPGYELMLRAGRGVAAAARRMAAPGARILVICGAGNNGGDGYVAARLLQAEGRDVDVMAPLGPATTADAGQAAADWAHAHGAAVAVDVDLASYGLVIDALFGAGLNRPLEGVALDLAQRINAAALPVLAVDVPSGLSADSGQVLGAAMGASVSATATVTFAARKPGHLLLPGRALCGAVTCIDIGIAPGTIASVGRGMFYNSPDLWLTRFPAPSLEAHKYRRGHVLCGSGGPLSTGAIRLAARSALRVGAGLATIAAGPDACRVHAAHLTAVMIREAEGAGDFARLLDDVRFNAVILGPAGGVGPELAARVEEAILRGRALVIDADAISSFAGAPERMAALIVAGGGAPVVMTPHDGEFARLFGKVAGVMDAGAKYERALAAARLAGAIVVLKGADTVIAAPDGRVAINDNAPPWLGTAGSGDVLSGLVGGLLAQGMPGFEAAAAAVWIHGAAARTFGPGLISEDLPEQVPAVLRRLLQQEPLA